MVRIKDRLLLGVVAGLGGNVAKSIIVKVAQKFKLAEFNGSTKAAGMLVPPHKIAEPTGRVIGHITDNIIACILGVGTVFMLSITGKDKAVLKGALTGQAMWCGLYGMLATMGATKINPGSTKTVLSEFIGHTAYGAVTAGLAEKLGDPGLFNGTIPLSTSPVSPTTRRKPGLLKKH